MSNDLEQLSEILTFLSGDGGDAVDWEAVSDAYRREFPADYREFVHRFGNGSIEGSIAIRIPVATADPMVRRVDSLPPAALENPDYDQWGDSFPAGLRRLDKLLVWGETDSADVLTWVAVNEDPGTWPVAVYNRGDAQWSLFTCSMSAFLARLLQGGFPECPLSDTSLFGAGEARFLHDREEERFAELGEYPWDDE
ncbi:hypothetical protein OG749_45525 [Streptomyces nojiriensis]|uniref:hypothetical protein n=1 Tax=Streptomyces nojiriensis TaxID=66374 RepID=UPI002E172DA5